MTIGIHSLGVQLRNLIDGAYPSFGQTYFVVDSDFRTQAQGWTRPDGTGPLDLAEERRPNKGGINYVYRTGDYASDSVCLQAAHDAAIAFRGDALFFTPGALSLAAVVNVTTESLRMIGPQVNYPLQARTSITAAIANAVSIAATCDDMELAFLKLIPLTNASWSVVSGACNRGYWHDFTYDANGVAGSTATSMVNVTGAALDWRFDHFAFLTDAAQGALIITGGDPLRLQISNFRHWHMLGVSPIGLLEVDGTATFGLDVGPGIGIVTGTTSAVTTLIDIADQAASTSGHGMVHDFDGSDYATATTLVTLAGATAEFRIHNCRFATVDSAATTTALMHVGSLYTG